MEFKDILNSSDYTKLQVIECQRADLRSKIDDPDLLPEVRAAYEAAINHLDKSLRSQAQQPTLQEDYATYGLEGTRGLEQIQPLEAILPEEQIAPLRENLRARVLTAKEFFDKYGAHTPEALEFVQLTGAELATATTTEVKPVQETPETTQPALTPAPVEIQERREEAKPLPIYVRHGIVKISKQGKSFKLSSKRAEQYYDYSHERLTALKTLAGGGIWTVQELKEKMGDPDMDNNHFAWIRGWLLDLTHGRNRLVESPKRGSYQFNPRYEPEIIEITTAAAEVQTPEWVSRGGDMCIVANQVSRFNPISRRLFGFEITGELVEQLKEYAPDHSAIRGDERAIWESRVEAFDRIFEDEDNLYKFLSVIIEGSPAYDFVDKLISLNENQRDLLRRFMRSKPEVEPLIDEKTAWCWVIDQETKDVVISLQIDLMPSTEVPAVDVEKPEVPPTDAQEEITPEQVVEGQIAPSANAKVSETEAAISYDYGEIEEPKRARLSRKARQNLDAIRAAAESIAENFLEHYNPERLYRRDQLEPHLSRLSTRNVANAVENNVGPSVGRGNIHRDFNIHDVVNILIYSDPNLRNIYSSSRLRKQAKYVIAQAIQRKIEEQKAKREK